MPRLSIVLPVYRSAERRRTWLQDAIWSILAAQTFRDLELIIVDDGSGDGNATRFVAAGSIGDDPRARILTSAKNQGMAGALNVGFAEATGEYLSWASDDNMMAPTCYERLVAALDEGADLVYGPWVRYQPGNKVLVLNDNPYHVGKARNECLCGFAFAYRRSLAEQAGPYQTRWDSDFFMWTEMERLGAKIVSLPPPPLAMSRDHPGTVTRQHVKPPDQPQLARPTVRGIEWVASWYGRKGSYGEAGRWQRTADLYAQYAAHRIASSMIRCPNALEDFDPC